ncbi:MAG: 23S rRNA (guanosine(2251)-2'-O)-methyltransferase RlmB [Candidatus Riflebacteria bacterium]|nr:23S rRNA (guanosine(2251)-2'-O)-methyltransferase RlmB [Candidatus Riflebacteria bacterium]
MPMPPRREGPPSKSQHKHPIKDSSGRDSVRSPATEKRDPVLVKRKPGMTSADPVARNTAGRFGRFADRRPARNPQSDGSSNDQMDGPVLVIGRHEVLAALRAGTPIEGLLLREGIRGTEDVIEAARLRSVKWQFLPPEAFNKKYPNAKQGFVARLGAFAYADMDKLLADAKAAKRAIVVALNHVEDPRNLGAVVRTAECVGAHGVIIPLHRAAGMTEWAIRTSQGAALHLPVARVVNIGEAIEQFRRAGFHIVGLAENGSNRYDQVRYMDKLVLVVGGEDEGLGPRIRAVCDDIVRLPMFGKTPSLNVSVSTSVALYEILKQHGFGEEKNAQIS